MRRLLSRQCLLPACLHSRVSAVVTSDVAGSHIVAPGEITFGLNLDTVVGLAFAELEDFPICTGTLISDRHILSAGYCVDYDGDGLPAAECCGAI